MTTDEEIDRIEREEQLFWEFMDSLNEVEC